MVKNCPFFIVITKLRIYNYKEEQTFILNIKDSSFNIFNIFTGIFTILYQISK